LDGRADRRGRVARGQEPHVPLPRHDLRGEGGELPPRRGGPRDRRAAAVAGALPRQAVRPHDRPATAARAALEEEPRHELRRPRALRVRGAPGRAPLPAAQRAVPRLDERQHRGARFAGHRPGEPREAPVGGKPERRHQANGWARRAGPAAAASRGRRSARANAYASKVAVRVNSSRPSSPTTTAPSASSQAWPATAPSGPRLKPKWMREGTPRRDSMACPASDCATQRASGTKRLADATARPSASTWPRSGDAATDRPERPPPARPAQRAWTSANVPLASDRRASHSWTSASPRRSRPLAPTLLSRASGPAGGRVSRSGHQPAAAAAEEPSWSRGSFSPPAKSASPPRPRPTVTWKPRLSATAKRHASASRGWLSAPRPWRCRARLTPIWVSRHVRLSGGADPTAVACPSAGAARPPRRHRRT